MSNNIPDGKLATVVQKLGRHRKKQTIRLNIDEIGYLQVCMAGAKLGNDHRQGDRELGRIYPRGVLKISDFSLIDRLERRLLKPRTKEDFEIQEEWGLEAIPWKAPVGAKFKAPESVAEAAISNEIPPAVAAALGIETTDTEEPEDDEEELPNFKSMSKSQVAQYAVKHDVSYPKKASKDTIVKAIIEHFVEEDDEEDE